MTFGYLLVLGGIVVVLVEIVVAAVIEALGDVSCFIHLIEGTGVLGGSSD